MTIRPAGPSLLTVGVLLAACGGGGGDASPTPDESSTGALTATCDLKGSSGGTATLDQTSDGLVVTFAGLPAPASGTVLYSVTAYDQAGETGGQLGAKYQDGNQIAYFVFDSATAQQTNLEGSPQVASDGLQASVDDADLGPLSGVDVGQWSAAYSVDGKDVGTCPGGFDLLPFPG